MSDPVKIFTDDLLPQLQMILGPSYTYNIREPTESELQPKQCWLVIDALDFGESYADLLTQIEFKQRIYVTVMYEISKEALHYLQVRLKRKEVMRAVFRTIRGLPDDITPSIDQENAIITEALFAATIPVDLIWTEGVDS